MIDTDKMKAAYAATPLCQNHWTKKNGTNPTMLCAVSALVAFAGVTPDLLAKMSDKLSGSEFVDFCGYVLDVEYGIPQDVSAEFPDLFDAARSEWRGVSTVLLRCEQSNTDELHELHAEALREDGSRSGPQFYRIEIPVAANS